MHFLCLACVLTTTAAEISPTQFNLAPNGSFEADRKSFGGWYPIGVLPDGDQFGLHVVDTVHRDGKRSLRITPGPTGNVTGTHYFPNYNASEGKRPMTAAGGVRGARTYALRLDRDVASLSASVWVKRPNHAAIRLTAVWTTRRRREPVIELHRDTISQPASSENGWDRFDLSAPRPDEAHQVQLWIETDATAPIYMDDVNLTLNHRPRLEVLVDQLGYETESHAKGIVLQSTYALDNVPPVRIIDVETFQEVLTKPWTPRGYLPSWDRYHWTADLSELHRPGRYVARVGRARQAVTSPPFEIADDLVTSRTAKLAYRFYYYQRCGTAVPGFHQACHLDDAKMPDGSWKDLTGGWHDAGDYNKYNGYTPETFYALIVAYHRKSQLFDQWDDDANGLPDIIDEALWGAQFLRKALDEKTLKLVNTITSGYGYWDRPELETDNQPDTGDERVVKGGPANPSYCVAGFALLGHHLRRAGRPKEAQPYIELAERLYADVGGGIDRLWPLWIATQNEKYRQAARRRAETLLSQQTDAGVVGFRELAQYALAFPSDPLIAKIKPLAERRVAELQAMCDPRFGLTVHSKDAAGALTYFRPYNDVNDWYIGQTMNYLDSAIDGIFAAKLGAVAGRAVAENQVHWVLGRNVFGTSMMESVGSVFVPGYHHRYNTIPGNPRGAVPGSLLNGITRLCPEHDRPWLDLHPEPNADWQSNEPWLPHNNRWLLLVSLW